MSVFLGARCATILVVALLSLLIMATPVAVSADDDISSPSSSCGELVVRAILNGGTETPTMHCDLEAYEELTSAVDTAFEAYYEELTSDSYEVLHEHRQLRGDAGPGRTRKLHHNCAVVCQNLPLGVCYDTYYHCRTWVMQQNRDLAAATPPPAATVVVLDDIFSGTASIHGGGGDGDRQLTDLTCGYTEEDCNNEKEIFKTTLLSKANAVDSTCGSLLLAPMQVQCLLVIPHNPALTPTPTPAPEPASSWTEFHPWW